MYLYLGNNHYDRCWANRQIFSAPKSTAMIFSLETEFLLKGQTSSLIYCLKICFLEERLEEKHPEGLRIFLSVDRAVSSHCRANKKATSGPLEGSCNTDDRARPGNTSAGGLHLSPRLLSRRRQCSTYIFQKVWNPCKVWCLGCQQGPQVGPK